jgi:hypothetical protein
MVLHAVLPTPYFSPTRLINELKLMFQTRIPRTTGVTSNNGSQFCQSLAAIEDKNRATYMLKFCIIDPFYFLCNFFRCK